MARKETRRFQDSRGLLPLSPVDADARWRTSRPGKSSGLNYPDNAQINSGMDRGGFILSRGVTNASGGEWKAASQLSWRRSHRALLAADTAYNAGKLRRILVEVGITAHIPIHPRQESNMVPRGVFE